MKRIGILSSVLILNIISISCSNSSNTINNTKVKPSDAVGSVGNDYVTYTELTENFGSGNINSEYTLEELQEFLPIYLDYKAKLFQATETGYFEKQSIIEELEVYAKQAAYAYWLDQEIKPTKFNEFKRKYTQELKSSHVLISLGANASPEDTLEVYNRIMEARTKFLEGATMADLDSEYSSKRDGRSMGGDLPWVTSGGFVAPFENALYALDVGEISMPVRTQFGYHIILLEDKRERVPARSVNHIYVRRGPNQSIIDSAYKALNDGMAWEEAVREFSDDRPSIPNQGNIGWIDNTSRYNPDFISAVMELEAPLPYSSPILTSYGYHIFYIDSVRSFKNEDRFNEFLRQQMEDANIVRETNGFVVDYLQEKFSHTSETDVYIELMDHVSSLDTVTIKELTLVDSIATKVVYKFNSTEFTTSDYLSYLKETRGDQVSVPFNPNWITLFQDHVVDNQIIDLTIDKFPEFQDQVDSYKFGIVVYQINEDSVWSSSTVDSIFIEQKFQNDIENYQFDERAHYYIITSRQDTTLENAKEFIMNGNSPDSLISNSFNVGVNSDSTGTFQGEPFDKLMQMEEGELSEIFEYGQRKGFFYLVRKLPARSMTLDEAYSRVFSDYIPEREENWLNRLREIYNIEVYPDIVQSAYSEEMNIE